MNISDTTARHVTKYGGFTLIEVLIVVAIIGILSTLVLANVSQAQNEARATETVRHFQEMEKAFRLWGTADNRRTWWTESELGLGDNPTIEAIHSDSGLGFSDHMPSVPESSVGDAYRYDYEEGDIILTECPTESSSPDSPVDGVNIVIRDADLTLFSEINQKVDGNESGDEDECGRVRAGTLDPPGEPPTDIILYTMSETEGF